MKRNSGMWLQGMWLQAEEKQVPLYQSQKRLLFLREGLKKKA